MVAVEGIGAAMILKNALWSCATTYLSLRQYLEWEMKVSSEILHESTAIKIVFVYFEDI